MNELPKNWSAGCARKASRSVQKEMDWQQIAAITSQWASRSGQMSWLRISRRSMKWWSSSGRSKGRTSINGRPRVRESVEYAQELRKGMKWLNIRGKKWKASRRNALAAKWRRWIASSRSHPRGAGGGHQAAALWERDPFFPCGSIKMDRRKSAKEIWIDPTWEQADMIRSIFDADGWYPLLVCKKAANS